MTPELKAAWLADLRSGKHPQAKGGLRTEDGFCCLGRLCDAAGATWTRVARRGFSFYYCEYGTDSLATEEILNELGISEEIMNVAMTMNDGISLHHYNIELPGFERRVHSFEEIADWLERQGDLTGKPVL